MSGQIHFVIIISVIIFDVVASWFYIEVLKKTPVHWLIWIIRAAIVFYVVRNPEPLAWLNVSTNLLWILKALNSGIIYWFLFDTGLNLARNKPVDHLGEGKNAAFLDRMQIKYLGHYYAFVIKGILALFAAANMLYNYNPYP